MDLDFRRHDYQFRLTAETAASLSISLKGNFIKTLQIRESALTKEVVRSLTDGLSKEPNLLTELHLLECTIQAIEEADQLERMFRLIRVSDVTLDGNHGPHLHKKIFQGLKRNTTLRTLLIRGTPLVEDDIYELVCAVKENSSLESFILSGVAQIHQKSCQILQEILETKRNITALNLINCNIDDPVCKYLAEGLKRNQTLTQLDISENKIKSSGITSLCHSLKTNTSLRTLVLSDNPDLGVNGLTALKDMLSMNNTLRKLWLSHCFGPREENEVDLICTGLKQNTSLTFVDIYSSDLDDMFTYAKFCSAIEEVLEVNYALREVQQYKNNNQILQLLKRNRDLQAEVLFNRAILVHNIAWSTEIPMGLPKELWLEILSRVDYPGLDPVVNSIKLLNRIQSGFIVRVTNTYYK